MSILITGMEMPNKKNGAVLIIYPDGKCAFEDGKTYQAVPVPPHGDLIERKAAYDSLFSGMVMTGFQSRALDCINEFYVPTIIPAEEGET